MNFQNNFQGVNHQYTPEFLNQWSTNQEILYRNMPHDKVDWSSLAREWIEMQQSSIQNALMQPPQTAHHQNVLFNEMNSLAEMQFLQQHTRANQGILLHHHRPPPPMHLNNFNFHLVPNHPFGQAPPMPNPQQQHFMHPHHHNLQPPPPQLQMNPPFNEPFNHPLSQPQQFNHHQPPPHQPLPHQPPPHLPQQPNFIQQQQPPPPQMRKEPPLLPPFEPQGTNFNSRNDEHSSKPMVRPNNKPMMFNDFKNNVSKVDFNQNMREDTGRMMSHLNGDHSKQDKSQSKSPINQQLQFNQHQTNKLNRQITNQLDQETATNAAADETNGDANRRKKLLPEWIRLGLERMEKEKQKKIEKEENLIKKAKEEQIRKELELDEEGKDESELELKQKALSKIEEKKKLFSSGSSLHQKTFADMFLVKKSKDYYYESAEAREKELMLRTKKVLTSILIEVTDSLVRQVASKCIQEAKIQKFAALSKQLAKPQSITSTGLGGIVSQYLSDSDDSNDGDAKKDSKASDGKSKDRRNDSKQDDKLKESRHRSRSKERRRENRSKDHESRTKNDSKRRSRSKESFRRRSRSKEKSRRRSKSKESFRKRSRSKDDSRRRSDSKNRKRSLSKESSRKKRDRSKDNLRRSRSKERNRLKDESTDHKKRSSSRERKSKRDDISHSKRKSRSKERRKHRSKSKERPSSSRRRSRSRDKSDHKEGSKNSHKDTSKSSSNDKSRSKRSRSRERSSKKRQRSNSKKR